MILRTFTSPTTGSSGWLTYTMLGARQATAASTSSAAHASIKRRTTFSLRAMTASISVHSSVICNLPR